VIFSATTQKVRSPVILKKKTRRANNTPVKKVYYPKVNPSRPYYEAARTSNGGYGGLLSVTFYSIDAAAVFFDNLSVDKGPSLGTNFTLAYVLRDRVLR